MGKPKATGMDRSGTKSETWIQRVFVIKSKEKNIDMFMNVI
jgi:hypothetical protein